jgi:hypothetical protein
MSGFKFDIPKDKYDKIMYWVNKSSDEVSGFGTLTFADNTFRLEEVFLLDQKVGGAHTDIDAESLSKLEYKCFSEKVKGNLNFWWHSHVKMDVFWSGTDKATIEELGKNGWILASVFNQKDEVRTAYCAQVTMPFIGVTHHMVDQVDTEISGYYPNGTEEWDREFKEKVTDKKVVEQPFTGMFQSYGTWDHINQKWNKRETELTHLESIVKQDTTNYEAEVAEEARLLGMKVKHYKHKLKHGTPEELEEMDFKLMTLRSRGAYGYNY